MPLSPGTRIGHYDVTALLGVGGMGEVYRAHDTKLQRDVALKVLPAAVARDPERMARFEREARVLASLNHPNIAALYGIEDSGATRALVMELVEGPTLADRLASGAIPAEEALAIARQIVDAVEYAHDRAVIHRDLKPANVKLTSEGAVKVLDFGLAKALSNESGSLDPQNSPTLTMGATNAGVILGTAAYMAPEQAKGKAVDRRADIWAFGAVLFEMLTGKPLFTGETAAEIMASAIKEEPKLERLPASTPAPVRKLIGRCLHKDPKQRLQAIGEARIVLAGPMEERPAARASQAGWAKIAGWGVAAVALAALGALGWRHSSEEPPPVVKLQFAPPEKGSFYAGGPPAISPDGRKIVLSADVDGKRTLWVRDLDSLSARILEGTEGGFNPFWSPDSRSVAFFAAGKLKKLDVAGGSVLTVCDSPIGRGGTWNQDNIILFTPDTTSGLMRVTAAGGTPTPVTELEKARNEISHRWPWFLPDGRHFLYLARSTVSEQTAVYAGDLQSKERTLVVQAASNAVFVAPGELLFVRDQTLMVQPFDAAKLQTTGDAVPVAEQVDFSGAAAVGSFTASQNGILAYSSGGGGSDRQITWFDRSGKAVGTVGKPANIEWTSLSPDGKRVAADSLDPQSDKYDIWLYDLVRGTEQRLTFSGNSRFPIWSPDGVRITYRGDKGIVQKNANGTGSEEVLEAAQKVPTDWSRDGRYLLSTTVFSSPKTGADIWVHPQSGDTKAFAYLATEFNESYEKLSPDARWLAYVSNESKRNEIYVMSFPKPGGKWQISTNGGRIPVWSHDGRELYFVSADSKMMAVEIKPGAKFEAGVPKPLFDVRLAGNNPNFNVSADGRFLIATPVAESASVPMTVVLNWQAGLKK